MSATTSANMNKACEGDAVKLAPMRMADAVRQQPNAPTESAAKSTGYVLPHLRKADAAQPAAPKSLDTNSASDFPTLGTAASNRGVASASWSQIRNRFQAPAPAAAPAAAAAVATTANQFAALDDDPADAVKKREPTNFKKVIKDRIKREEAERQGLQDEPTDPQLMSREQLEREGWAVLSLPPGSADPQDRAAWFAAYAAREIAKELKRDREFEALCEIYAPAGTVEPELRRPAARPAAAADADYESEPENEYYEDHASEEVEVY